jgi:uncharacterized protein (TIRG00374 family)
MRKRLRLLLGLAVSAFFVYLALRGLSLAEVGNWLSRANYLWLIPSVLVYFVAVWGRTWRWHYMLRPIKSISLGSLFPVVCIGYMGNNIFPVRAGEVLRSYVLKRKEDVSMSASIATIVVERVFDGLVMLMFVFIALPFAPVSPELRTYVIAASGLFFVALVVFVILAAKPDFTRKVYTLTVRHFLPERLRESADGFLDRFLTGLHFLRSGRDVVMIFLTSVFIWLAETCKYWFVMEGFAGLGGGFPVPFFVLMLMNGIVNLATTIPSAPGYVGTFDTPGIAVLAAYGVDRDLAFGYTIVLHAALWFPITVLGAWYFRREQLAWSDVETARAQRAASLEAS